MPAYCVLPRGPSQSSWDHSPVGFEPSLGVIALHAHGAPAQKGTPSHNIFFFRSVTWQTPQTSVCGFAYPHSEGGKAPPPRFLRVVGFRGRFHGGLGHLFWELPQPKGPCPLFSGGTFLFLTPVYAIPFSLRPVTAGHNPRAPRVFSFSGVFLSQKKNPNKKKKKQTPKEGPIGWGAPSEGQG